MTEQASASELRARLSEVERDLEALRATAVSVRGDVADQDDPTDRGALIQQADELDNQVDVLTARRDDLRRKLGE